MTRSPFGLTLTNRAVVLGVMKARDLIDLTVTAEASGVFDAVWVGDSLLAKPRLESVTLLSALAAVTTKVRLGVGCLATSCTATPCSSPSSGRASMCSRTAAPGWPCAWADPTRCPEPRRSSTR
jgi:hypothetical protein